MTVEAKLFQQLTMRRNDSEELKHCMERTVDQLLHSNTDPQRPGMLLGKIQSGKTRAFIGIMALAFDRGIDLAVVLTKGTNALTEQTYQRLSEDFGPFIEDDLVQVYDIMHLPKNLTRFILQQKLVFVVKKQADNLKRTLDALTKRYPDLQRRRLLIIDDEADFASLTFRKNSDTDEIEPGKIAKWVDQLRGATAGVHFLQVTATPYSLYLQPNDTENTALFHPNRPAFTELVPTHPSYIGGDFYFSESDDETSIAHFVYEEVPLTERDVLKAADGRSFKIEHVLESKRVAVLRRAILNFIVGGSIRRLQQKLSGARQEKYSFIVHTEQSRKSHAWQERIVQRLRDELVRIAADEPARLDDLLREAYIDLERSLKLTSEVYPSREEAIAAARQALLDEHVMVVVVNSDNQVKDLLDAKGQLRLDAPLTVFIGGSILDRGVTIRNLIGFYYGRNPQSFQQDTVLQHARMYGARPRPDLEVTRFYTTEHIHQVMKQIYDFDTALRHAIERGEQQNGVYFLRADSSGRIKPCSPNKILVSDIVTLRPHRRMLPVGFQTDYKVRIGKKVEELDRTIRAVDAAPDRPQLVDYSVAADILRSIGDTYVWPDEDYAWDFESHVAGLEHLSSSTESANRGKVWVIAREGGDLKRVREDDGRYSNAPESYQERNLAKQLATDAPVLLLLRQNGTADGWRDTPFWWPVIIPPAQTKTTIFASKTKGETD